MRNAKVVCHRGACLTAPENTIAALDGAVALCADVIEFDVRQSADGVLYVFHDETLERTSNGSVRFAETHSSVIDTLDAGSWFDPRYAGERIPRLDVFLKACSGRIATYAEIKDADPVLVRDMLQAEGLLETAWTFSFDPDIRKATRVRTPDFRRMVLFEHVGSVRAAVAEGAAILEFHEGDLTPDLVQEAKAAQLITQLFYDGEEERVFSKAVKLGIDQMNIDHVDKFRAVEANFY
ncbi:glycerophosphodiester phosphodiesterase [Roseibium sediminis]|uniref:glycerophosphodiester phosphodiesterase n=1 Tax=Roseibium sediminis TaxID=1775174 RepID=UPI00123D49F8|nr:glycerophosphodiester phosphodiesterase family protein [Roseibium sediminis]